MKKGQSGFSMIELLITVAVMGILGALALPGFSSLIASNRLTSVANEMLTGVMLARGEAVKRGKRVVMCKSSDFSTCNTSGTWSGGWIVFVDDNDDGVRASSGTVEELLRVWQGSAQVTSSVTGTVSDNLSFTNGGTVRAPGTTTVQSGTITLCISGQASRQLQVASTGRVSVVKGSNCS